MPAHIWSMLYGHSADAVLLVLTSDAYNKSGYISDYGEFCSLASQPEWSTPLTQ
ncbi:MAG: WxcM-like domain-containing protein [Methylocella sp.]